jgi:hypothetical protein
MQDHPLTATYRRKFYRYDSTFRKKQNSALRVIEIMESGKYQAIVAERKTDDGKSVFDVYRRKK